MNAIEALRAAHERLITENPVTITINRTQQVEAGGGFSRTPSVAGPFIVRVFQRQNKAFSKEVSAVAGKKQVDLGWELLADYRADIQAGPRVKDEFDVPGLGNFVVNAVRPQRAFGQLVGYQADLEKVS